MPLSPSKIYVSNLDKTINDTQLKEHFAKFGEIVDIQRPLERNNRQPKEYAFLTFSEPSAATNALALDGKPLLERVITVQIATEKC